ncbi:hypothetical protein EBZ80_22515 [bacterium]|nr:hypothetical protein [bacterium]
MGLLLLLIQILLEQYLQLVVMLVLVQQVLDINYMWLEIYTLQVLYIVQTLHLRILLERLLVQVVQI